MLSLPAPSSELDREKIYMRPSLRMVPRFGLDGISRDEEALLPTVYLNKLPEKHPEGSRVLVVDPMLATSGTIVAALEMLRDRGVDFKQIKVISALAAPPALQKLSENFPGLHVYTGTIDPTVNEKGGRPSDFGDAKTGKLNAGGAYTLNTASAWLFTKSQGCGAAGTSNNFCNGNIIGAQHFVAAAVA
ncbi:hypothetical protein MKW98_010453 [Papaver atlanticum]|uniref:uracil phosphoribosyltransferase n=1 Tax=Papaver atlanticum TaxID=357466 RepID=A0AAD4TBH3_9MAGN|nr:hypothetical protein MKW98_010453 [Papaver atlanticum]